MKADFVEPLCGYVLVKHAPEETTTKEGVFHTDNDDTFVVYGTVVKTPPDCEFKPGEEVVFHALEATVGFYDGEDRYSFIEENLILARYVRH